MKTQYTQSGIAIRKIFGQQVAINRIVDDEGLYKKADLDVDEALRDLDDLLHAYGQVIAKFIVDGVTYFFLAEVIGESLYIVSHTED